ncbi:MAG: hypothetical protein E7623_00225 [Ruminococcaceae bacterium]|nr:hypothetical protein [Oscillospiraceae bacterium]
MKNILLIGVGGTGSRAVDTFFKRYQQFGKHNDNHITALVFDTDAGDIKNIDAATPVVMADSASVGTVCDRFGKNYLREWFPCDNEQVRSQEMVRGASQWRKKSYLAFLNLMNKPLERAKFIGALEKMVADPAAICEIYVISSVAGGTGSGSFIPIALFAKRYIRKNLGKDPIVNAMIALPEIFADSQTPENKIKVYANAYAILRELNAINLVARNYNAGRSAQKKAPVKFRIGHPDEPTVGVLFDASDKSYWTPEAAPFSQVFLLDRIPGLNSVSAHEIVLANSLYTILCTDIGAAFDSEFSNHELLRSQNNGSNAVYAGVSTSQIRFPVDSILEYVAHQKTLDSCDNEWLVLHKKVEATIREKEQFAKESKSRYTMKDGEYANLVLEAFDDIAANESNDDIVSLVERGTALYDEKGKKLDATVVDSYFAELEELIKTKITNTEDIANQINEEFYVDEKAKVTKMEIVPKAIAASEYLLKYFQECVSEIKRTTTSTADSVITLDKKKQEYAEGKMYFADRILCKKGDYIHPVAAMVQLCRFRKLLTDKIDSRFEEWKEIRARKIESVPEFLLTVPEDDTDEIDFNVSKSRYYGLGEERFIKTSREEENFNKAKTDPKADVKMIAIDAKRIAENICWSAQSQLMQKVFVRIAKDVDELISKYRNFFNRFEKEKEELVEATKTAKRKDSGNIDSAINVFSSKEAKERIFKEIVSEGGPATESELVATDSVVGKGVFESAYKAAIAASSGDNWNDKDSKAYKSLFSSMVDSYRKFITKNEAYEKIASYNAIEAIVASCGENPNPKDIEAAFRSSFSIAQDLATPSLRLKAECDGEELVQPSNIIVFMISLETGKYIKKHAEEFGLRLPADQTKESDIIRSCSEEFIRTYSGNSAARVSIVSTVSDQVLYCTGEIMDITPLRIAKFDELGADNTYYRNYCTALENSKKYDTDMWNPHIGFDLHKRGYLPFMNKEKEKQCDDQMIKALFYGFKSEELVYKPGIGGDKGRYYFEYKDTRITDTEGKLINSKNVAQLVAWMRNETDLVDEWSKKFDEDIARQMTALPSIASDNPSEISALESAMTRMPFMRMLTESLFRDASDKGNKSCRKVRIEGGRPANVDRVGPNIIEFAYMIKTSEELGRDCDDAERILKVAYNVFRDITEFRTNSVNTPERFIQVYRQQLDNVFEAVAGSKLVCNSGANSRDYFNNIAMWLNRSNTFKTVCIDNPMDETGKICVNSNYDLSSKDYGADVCRILEFIASNFKDEDTEEKTEAEEIAEIVETEA